MTRFSRFQPIIGIRGLQYLPMAKTWTHDQVLHDLMTKKSLQIELINTSTLRDIN